MAVDLSSDNEVGAAVERQGKQQCDIGREMASEKCFGMWTVGDTHWDAQEVDALVFVNTIHTDTRLEIGAIYTVANPGVEREGGIDCVMKRQCQGGGWLVVLAADNLAIVVQLVALGNAYECLGHLGREELAVLQYIHFALVPVGYRYAFVLSGGTGGGNGWQYQGMGALDRRFVSE